MNMDNFYINLETDVEEYVHKSSSHFIFRASGMGVYIQVGCDIDMTDFLPMNETNIQYQLDKCVMDAISKMESSINEKERMMWLVLSEYISMKTPEKIVYEQKGYVEATRRKSDGISISPTKPSPITWDELEAITSKMLLPKKPLTKSSLERLLPPKSPEWLTSELMDASITDFLSDAYKTPEWKPLKIRFEDKEKKR